MREKQLNTVKLRPKKQVRPLKDKQIDHIHPAKLNVGVYNNFIGVQNKFLSIYTAGISHGVRNMLMTDTQDYGPLNPWKKHPTAHIQRMK